jgi:hypothetical protein
LKDLRLELRAVVLRKRLALAKQHSEVPGPGRNFLVALRLYGTEDAFYDQTWKPDDVVKVK